MGMVYQLMLKERDIALMGPHTLTNTLHTACWVKRRTLVSSVSTPDGKGSEDKTGSDSCTSNCPTSCEIFTVCMVRQWAIPFNKGIPLQMSELFAYPGTDGSLQRI